MNINVAGEISSFQLMCLPDTVQGFTEIGGLLTVSGVVVLTYVAAWCRISGALTLLSDIHLVKTSKPILGTAN